MRYFDELARAMEWLGKQPDTFFLGQAVACPGTAMSNTLRNVPKEKLWEMPVNEDMQMGMSIGMSLKGTLPISIFPRWNFLLLATNQIVNHLDKIPMSSEYRPKVIIRTSIGADRPLHPQHQHVGDFTDAFSLMCKTVSVVRLDEPEQIFPAYQLAYMHPYSTILVEHGNYYSEK